MAATSVSRHSRSKSPANRPSSRKSALKRSKSRRPAGDNFSPVTNAELSALKDPAKQRWTTAGAPKTPPHELPAVTPEVAESLHRQALWLTGLMGGRLTVEYQPAAIWGDEADAEHDDRPAPSRGHLFNVDLAAPAADDTDGPDSPVMNFDHRDHDGVMPGAVAELRRVGQIYFGLALQLEQAAITRRPLPRLPAKPVTPRLQNPERFAVVLIPSDGSDGKREVAAEDYTAADAAAYADEFNRLERERPVGLHAIVVKQNELTATDSLAIAAAA